MLNEKTLITPIGKLKVLMGGHSIYPLKIDIITSISHKKSYIPELDFRSFTFRILFLLTINIEIAKMENVGNKSSRSTSSRSTRRQDLENALEHFRSSVYSFLAFFRHILPQQLIFTSSSISSNIDKKGMYVSLKS